jgi:hypothetical protein
MRLLAGMDLNTRNDRTGGPGNRQGDPKSSNLSPWSPARSEPEDSEAGTNAPETLEAEQIAKMSVSRLARMDNQTLARIVHEQALVNVQLSTQLSFIQSRELVANRQIPLSIDLDRQTRKGVRAEQELISGRLLEDYQEKLLDAFRQQKKPQVILPARFDSQEVGLVWRDIRQQMFRILELPVLASSLDTLDKKECLESQLLRLTEIYRPYFNIAILNVDTTATLLLASRTASYVYLENFVPNRIDAAWRTAFEMNLDNPKSLTAKALVLITQQTVALANLQMKEAPLKLLETLRSHLVPLKPPYL